MVGGRSFQRSEFASLEELYATACRTVGVPEQTLLSCVRKLVRVFTTQPASIQASLARHPSLRDQLADVQARLDRASARAELFERAVREARQHGELEALSQCVDRATIDP